MRVIAPAAETPVIHSGVRIPARNVELLGLAGATLLVVFGVVLAWAGRTARLQVDDAAGPVVQLDRLRSPGPLERLLTMYEQPAERRAVARALFARIGGDEPLDHVGALAGVTLTASAIAREPRFVQLRARLARTPGATEVPVLAGSDLAAIKPQLAVRSHSEYRRTLAGALALLLAAFWTAHAVRRWRGESDDPTLLPAVMLVCGIGMASMIALRDPLRDTIIASPFATGVAGGVLLLLAVSELDLEASALRRSVLAPLAGALALAVLLLVFGSGPGTSGAKVNLLGMQPVEAIRLLVILALAAYFARRLDVLRELTEPLAVGPRWVRWIRGPRWRDVRPIAVSMALVLAFFFLQKDLGPALVMSCVFLALYGTARGRAPFVIFGIALLLAGFAVAYVIGFPGTVRQRVMMWADPWNNGVFGGNQVAHGLWALATGGLAGLGHGLGSPQFIPAGHTDFVLAVVGEELGVVGLVAMFALYVFVCWRCVRIALRAPGDYTAFLVLGLTFALAVQAMLIAGGLLGLVPLAGVVTPFLSYGKSSMLANFAALGAVMAVARRPGSVRRHLLRPVQVVSTVLGCGAALLVARAIWIQAPGADDYATRASFGRQADGVQRFEYNPRLLAAARQIPRGTIYDRRGLPVATSSPEEIDTLAPAYRRAGIAPVEPCDPTDSRCYPLGGIGFHVIGDWRTQANWGAANSSYIERDRAAQLQGFDDRSRLVEIVNPRTSERVRAVRRDYADLFAFARNRYRPSSGAVQAVLTRDRSVHSSLDAALQFRTAQALARGIEARGGGRGAAVVLDAESGAVLAAVSYPWPSADEVAGEDAEEHGDASDAYLDRVRYALYPPGSVFKLLVAAAALRSNTDASFACVPLAGGRVGTPLRGSRRPVRDDPLDTIAHGTVDLHRGLVVSCNAYFAQLALALGPRPIVDAADVFEIATARTPTAAGLRATLPHAGYGQGEVLVSPLKMARVAASIAAGGRAIQARWERGRLEGDEHARFLSAADAATLGRYMREVVTSGTGRVLKSNPTPIAGKTGTAEVAGGRAHSWFVGFAPYGGRRPIAFAVVVENAGYGARAAAPIAGEIVTAAREVGLFNVKEESR